MRVVMARIIADTFIDPVLKGSHQNKFTLVDADPSRLAALLVS